MDNFELLWLLLALLGGLVIGALAALFFSRRRSKTKSYRELESQHEQLQDSVSEHFVKTANLVNDLTDAYKAVFDHLQQGASELVKPEVLQQQLEYDSDKVVTLTRLGHTDEGSPPADAETDASPGAEAPAQDQDDAETMQPADPEAAREPPRF